MAGAAIAARREAPARGARTLVSLEREIVACELCPRLRRHCLDVARKKKREFADQTYWGKPVPGFGDPDARLLVVGLAPAAHGGNRTGRVFTGDSSGDWLYAALHAHGFASQPNSVSRDDGMKLTGCWICAAGRCAPPGNKPTPDELARCRPYLEAEIRLLSDVGVTMVLGRIAHDAWLRASGWWERLGSGRRPTFAHGAEYALDARTTLLCSYHPSRQNTNTRRLTREMWNERFARARALVENSRGPAG